MPIQDAHYRYTMPVMEMAYEKSWTILPNLLHVGNALHRDQVEILKYFSVELCTAYGWKDERPALKSRVSATTIQKLLRHYIHDFCLCAKCHLPETAYRVRHGKILLQKCFACGAKVRMTDPDHKVCTYIVQDFAKRRHPTTTSPGDKKGGASSKAPKEKGKEAQKTRSTKLETKDDLSRTKERKNDAHPKLSAAPVLQKNGEKEDDASTSTVFEETVDAVLGTSPSSEKEWARCVIREVKCSSPLLTSKDSVRILFHSWFRESDQRRLITEQDTDQLLLPVDALRILLEKQDMMRRYMERYVVESLEEVFFDVLNDMHAITFVRWLKCIWEEDLVDQATLFAWAEDSSTLIDICFDNHCRLVKASRPFLIWLAENEEEESSTDEES